MTQKEYILSTTEDLKRIKRRQYKAQIIPVLIMALGISMQYWLPGLFFLNYPALAVTLIGIIWYLWNLSTHRYNNKVAIPSPDDLLSPLEGKVLYIRSNPDLNLINIRKSVFDVVELRCPHEDCKLEDDQLKLSTPSGNISIRFNASRLEWLKKDEWTAGELIGLVYGKASCTISLPTALEPEIKEGSLVFAGASPITNVSGQPKPSILVEETPTED